VIAFFWFAAPLLLLSLACVGAGILIVRLVPSLYAALPRWLYVALAYFVGQGVLATAFLVVAALAAARMPRQVDQRTAGAAA